MMTDKFFNKGGDDDEDILKKAMKGFVEFMV